MQPLHSYPGPSLRCYMHSNCHLWRCRLVRTAAKQNTTLSYSQDAKSGRLILICIGSHWYWTGTEAVTPQESPADCRGTGQ
eukprot:3866693-Karenia_brevis.AAC.1